MRPFSLLIKPAGPDCNIDCKYCFYSRKSEMFGPGRHRMTDDVLEKLVKDFLELGFPVNSFAFQGGEPSLMGLEFYQKLVDLQKKYGSDGQVITNALQTNGTLLDQQWCEFLHEYKFLVGISLDGPQKYHDHFRIDHAGKPTWQRVMDGIRNCKKYNVEYNILVLLNSFNVDYPDELFDFFIENKFKFLQFIQCVELDQGTGDISTFSITPRQYGDFLCRVFDRWLKYGPTKMSIRTFDSILSYLLEGRHTECTLGPRCNDYVVVEHDGGVYCCDFFVDNEWKLGNLMDENIGDLANSPLKSKFSKRKRDVPNKCSLCRYLHICRGGCPKDRVVTQGNKPISYFCESYQQLFGHTLPKLEEFAAMLRSQNGQ
ncbi:MAG: anaerobic sulfatase maturase [Phycisphaerae bacterium]|nr:anaerobic sulfatase maturase [Phycisphaerae bacterium]